MASPVIVGTTPVLLIPVNVSRKNVVIQNTGTNDVYIKRWPPGTVQPVPSASNYDFVLMAKPGEGNKEDWIFQTESVSAFVGVAATQTTTVAVMETVKVTL